MAMPLFRTLKLVSRQLQHHHHHHPHHASLELSCTLWLCLCQLSSRLKTVPKDTISASIQQDRPTVAYLGFGKGGHGKRAEHEPIMKVWEWSPQRGPGAEPLVGESGGLAPEAETLFAFERSMEVANLPIFFLKFGIAENHSVMSDAISHSDFNRILHQYEKRPSNIVEFCNSCWKTAKNAPFHIKSPVKNFHGWAKGGIAPWPSP